jgi:hypothetical protein
VHGALTVGDSLLEQQHNDLTQRPDLLLLAGDQIYADDVEASLLEVLREQATQLIGGSEILPSDFLPSDITKPQLNPISEIKLDGRTEVLKQHRSGLSSEEAGNHLQQQTYPAINSATGRGGLLQTVDSIH